MEVNHNYWKRKYKDVWRSGASRVKYVLAVLKDKFPDLIIEGKEYAVSDKYIPPDKEHEKHDPDIRISKRDTTIICEVEVTGSSIHLKPSDMIFILKGKYTVAQKRKRNMFLDTWFYLVYRNTEYVLDLELIAKFDGDKARTKYLKGVPEWYIEIPSTEAYPKEKLFEWIEKRV